MPRVLPVDEIRSALAHLPDWRLRLGALHTAYAAPSSAAALAFAAAVGEAAESADHHPDLDWRYRHVFLRTTTHQAGGAVTQRDLELAAAVSTLAADAGLTAVPQLSRTVEIAIDAADPEALKATWRAALGYRPGRDADELVDPWSRSPTVWFQRTATPAESRIHLDVHVVADEAPGVLDHVAGTGGRLLDGSHAPSWWVMADGDGNRLCVCTPAGRDDAGG
jgi:4a-hydroxytetrahydrobiopterin dehydratase